MFFLFFSWNTNLIEYHGAEYILRNNWGFATPAGPYFGVFLFWFEITMLIALLFLGRVYKKTLDDVKKKHVLLIIIAILIPLTIGTVTDGLMPLIGRYPPAAAIPLTSIMAIILTYAIFKYELFEFSSQAILSSVGEGIISLNTKGRIQQTNDGARNILHFNKDVRGLKFSKLVSTKDVRSQKKIPMSHLLQFKQKKVYRSLEIILSDKTTIPVSLTVTPIYQKQTKIGITFLIRDITEERKIEQAKDDFISVASHELKTPITNLKIFSQLLLRQTAKRSDTYKYVVHMKEQVDRLEELTGALLDLSRIQTGRIKIKKQRFYIDKIVKETVEEIQATVLSHQIIIEGQKNIPILADPSRTREVLRNLLTNAIKYSPDANRVIVRVSVYPHAAVVSVKDFGVGISTKYQKRVFERFFRADEKDRRSLQSGESKTAGFGIGLFISFEMVQMMDGEIWFESEEGRGSTFYVSLPIAKGKAKISPRRRSRSLGSAAAPAA